MQNQTLYAGFRIFNTEKASLLAKNLNVKREIPSTWLHHIEFIYH